jgi:hypothetical protein
MRTLSTKLGVLACLGAFAAISNGQLTVTGSGPFNSAGAPGDPGNFTTTVPNPAASALYGSFDFSGTLNAQTSLTWVQDSDWTIFNQNLNGGFLIEGTGIGSFTSENVSLHRGGLYWINQNDNLNFEASENADDVAGTDATWTNVSFAWSGGPSVTNLGTYASGTSFTFDTNTSDFDTMIALYTSTGQLLGTDDDSGAGVTSLLNSGALANGSYYFVASGFFSQFDNGVAVGGEDFGNLVANVNGVNVFNGTHDTNSVHTFGFTVAPVPEPASFAVLGLGAIALVRRRRSNK